MDEPLNVQSQPQPQPQPQPVAPPAPSLVVRPWEVGEVLLGLYQVMGILGQGGMGTVYRVRHLGWGVDLAVKCPRFKPDSPPRHLQAFVRECENWVRLDLHPHIVTCHYIRVMEGFPRIFAEFVEAGSLEDWVVEQRLYQGGHARSLERILRIAVQAAWGIKHAHQHGLIHRDIKPANILMTPEGVAKVSDFGLATARLQALAQEGSPASPKAASKGGMTPAYCSPEQVNNQPLSGATDVWSFALSLLEMLAGDVLWKHGREGASGLEYYLKNGALYPEAPPCPIPLRDLLWACLNSEPTGRPTMERLAAELPRLYHMVLGRPFPHPEPEPLRCRADALNNRAVSLMDINRATEAEGAWAAALQADPRHPESNYNAGLVQWRDGRWTDLDLVRRLKESSELDPNNPLPRRLLASVHLERRDCAAASDELERIQGDPAAEPLLALAKAQLPLAGHPAGVFEGHADRVNKIVFSQNGGYILSCSDDNTLRLWHVASGDCVRTLEGHIQSVMGLALSNDGRWAMSAGMDRAVRLWNMSTAICEAIFNEHPTPVVALDASSSFECAVSGERSGRLLLWNPIEQSYQGILGHHEGELRTIAVSPNGVIAATAGATGDIHIWHIESHKLQTVLVGHNGLVRALALSSDGLCLVSGGEDGNLCLWDVPEGRLTRCMPLSNAPIQTVSLEKGNRFAAVGCNDGLVMLCDLARGRCLRTYAGHKGVIETVAISRRASHIAAGGAEKAVRLWTTGHEMPLYRAPMVLCKALRSDAAFSSHGRFRALCDAAEAAIKQQDPPRALAILQEARALPGYRRHASAMRLWANLYGGLNRASLSGMWEQASWRAHIGPIVQAHFIADSAYALTGGEDGFARLWDLRTSGRLAEFQPCPDGMRDLTVGGGKIYAVGQDDNITQWDLRTTAKLGDLPGPPGRVECIAISPDGRFLVAGGWKMSIWHAPSRRLLFTLDEPPGHITRIVWRSDSSGFYCGESAGDIRFWELARLNPTQVLQAHSNSVNGIAVSGSGLEMFTSANHVYGREGELVVWREAASHPHRVVGEEGPLTGVAISFDGRVMAALYASGALRCWDPASLAPLPQAGGQCEQPACISISPDSAAMAVGGSDGMFHLWTLDWELATAPAPIDQDRLDTYLKAFIAGHAPCICETPDPGPLTAKTLRDLITRKPNPGLSGAPMPELHRWLGHAGYPLLDIPTALQRMRPWQTGLISRLLGR